jgi:hypothetical protein
MRSKPGAADLMTIFRSSGASNRRGLDGTLVWVQTIHAAGVLAYFSEFEKMKARL